MFVSYSNLLYVLCYVNCYQVVSKVTKKGTIAGTMSDHGHGSGLESPFKKLALESEEEARRSRKLTAKGQQYQEKLLEDLFSRTQKKLENHMNVIEELASTKNIDMLRQESNQFDEIFNKLHSFL